VEYKGIVVSGQFCAGMVREDAAPYGEPNECFQTRVQKMDIGNNAIWVCNGKGVKVRRKQNDNMGIQQS
jgi:hypothetical protein